MVYFIFLVQRAAEYIVNKTGATTKAAGASNLDTSTSSEPPSEQETAQNIMDTANAQSTQIDMLATVNQLLQQTQTVIHKFEKHKCLFSKKT